MLVYISGPITLGDTIQNVRTALDYAEEVVRCGHTPIVPHLSVFWHYLHPHEGLD